VERRDEVGRSEGTQDLDLSRPRDFVDHSTI